MKKILSKFGKKSSASLEGSATLDESIASKNPNDVVLAKAAARIKRPPLERYYAYGLAGLMGYAAADLAVLSIRDKMLPSSPPPSKMKMAPSAPRMARLEYNPITKRNIFNSDGLIPDPISGEGAKEDQEDNAAPVPSTLPLVLVGTIVHANPAKSVATIQVKSAGNKVIPYIPNDEIETLATLLKVERHKAIFRNKRSGRLEYIEIKIEGLKFGLMKKPQGIKSGEVQREGNNFSLNRSDVNKYIQNLPELLQQARAVPNIVPGSGGEVDGFRLVDIAPGSIYEKLGLKPNDVIKTVNGEDVNSPAKAMELYNSLKNDREIALDIERNGSKETLNFSIVE